jgi:tRNA pseudouridine55 synthase
VSPGPVHPFAHWNGALLIDKHAGVSSFGIIEELQRAICAHYGVKRRDLPKLGHGGTLDPFATGLLVVCMGRAVKLARYFLGSDKEYEGTIRFGETTVPGDPTAPVSERSERIPPGREELQRMAAAMSAQAYLQTPPMHSAKKQDGRPLYALAREGIEVEREPKLCHLRSFEILAYEPPHATFRLRASSGTYVRVLAQDFARMLGTVGMLDGLRRSASGRFRVEDAWTTARLAEALTQGKPWDELPCWVDFDRLLDGHEAIEATPEEALALTQGRQNVLVNILHRGGRPLGAMPPTASPDQVDTVVIQCSGKLVAVARREASGWGLERVFT